MKKLFMLLTCLFFEAAPVTVPVQRQAALSICPLSRSSVGLISAAMGLLAGCTTKALLRSDSRSARDKNEWAVFVGGTVALSLGFLGYLATPEFQYGLSSEVLKSAFDDELFECEFETPEAFYAYIQARFVRYQWKLADAYTYLSERRDMAFFHEERLRAIENACRDYGYEEITSGCKEALAKLVEVDRRLEKFFTWLSEHEKYPEQKILQMESIAAQDKRNAMAMLCIVAIFGMTVGYVHMIKAAVEITSQPVHMVIFRPL